MSKFELSNSSDNMLEHDKNDSRSEKLLKNETFLPLNGSLAEDVAEALMQLQEEYGPKVSNISAISDLLVLGIKLKASKQKCSPV